MRIVIETLPRGNMRYPTLGDWVVTADEMLIQVAEAPEEGDGWAGPYDPRLIAIHELVEAWLCQDEGVTQAEVDRFDFAFKGEGEPGDDPYSPYRRQHRKAALIEHMLASFFGLSDYGTVA